MKTLFKPLKKINPEEMQLLEKSEDQLQILWRYLKLGSLDKLGTDQTTDKLIRTIRKSISKKTLQLLTDRYNPIINWFFAAFPNRFLHSSPPDMLAENLSIFNQLDRQHDLLSLKDDLHPLRRASPKRKPA